MLIQLIYCSAASSTLGRQELASLLQAARQNNAKDNITGMLLYVEGSFFQVLEGEENNVMSLFKKIQQDMRHHSITVIIQEPIAKRSFSDWTMGYTDVTPGEISTIIGSNEIPDKEQTFSRLGKGRAKKLLAAFKKGHWRTKTSDNNLPFDKSNRISQEIHTYSPAAAKEFIHNERFSFAFQPIINAKTREVFAYEALLRGQKNESIKQVFKNLDQKEMGYVDKQSKPLAINLASHLGLSTHLNLNIRPSSIASSPGTIPSLLQALEQNHILPEQIILEILESEIIADFQSFTEALHEYRSAGFLFAIDDFGAGYAGLNLLANFQPQMIKLDLQLIRDVHTRGPQQAIIHGLLRTCFELGIDIIAEGVETENEFRWLRDEGIDLFQGYLFAKPEFENLPAIYHIPD